MQYKLCDKNKQIVQEFNLDIRKLKLNGNPILNIGQGIEGTAYRYKNNVFKIYKNKISILFYSKNYRLMQYINTKRILLPRYMILNSHNFPVGYTTNFVEKKHTNIMKMDKNVLISELKIIKEDIKLLSKNRILLSDVTQNNAVINGRIYFIDPGYYKINNNDDLLNRNYKIMNWYIKYNLLEYYIYREFEKQQKENNLYYGDVIEQCLTDYKNVFEFYEEKTKNRIIKLR